MHGIYTNFYLSLYTIHIERLFFNIGSGHLLVKRYVSEFKGYGKKMRIFPSIEFLQK